MKRISVGNSCRWMRYWMGNTAEPAVECRTTKQLLEEVLEMVKAGQIIYPGNHNEIH